MSTTSLEHLGTFLKKIRSRSIIQRLINIVTIALLVDLAADLFALVLFNLWDIKISIPFLFEVLLAVLILRDRTRWHPEKIGIDLDRRFSLKDRFYSFTWYGNNEKIPMETRRAQADETVDAVDLEKILAATRIRIPVLLPIVLPLFAGLIYLSWNSEYRPKGITSRVVEKGTQQLSRSGVEISGLDGKSIRSRDDRNEDLDGSTTSDPTEGKQDSLTDTPERFADNFSEKDKNAAEKDQAERSTDGSAEGDSESAAPGGGGGPGGTGDSDSEMGEHFTEGAPQPEYIQSVYQTESISEPIPPALARNSSFIFQELPDATNFLNLVPGQGGQALAPLDAVIINNFEKEIDRFPVAYRKNLQTYYLELKKWEKTP